MKPTDRKGHTRRADGTPRRRSHGVAWVKGRQEAQSRQKELTKAKPIVTALFFILFSIGAIVALTVFALALLHNPKDSAISALVTVAKQPDILTQPYDMEAIRRVQTEQESSTGYAWVTGPLCLVGFIGMLIFSSKHHGDIIRFEEQLPKNRRGKPRRKWRSTAGLERATRTSRIGKRISFLTVLGSAIFGIIAFFIERV